MEHAWVLISNQFRLLLETPEANRNVCEMFTALGRVSERDELARLKKRNRLKVIYTAVLKARTAVGNHWSTERLLMGHSSYVSILVERIRRDKNEQKTLKNITAFKESRTAPIDAPIEACVFDLFGRAGWEVWRRWAAQVSKGYGCCYSKRVRNKIGIRLIRRGNA